MSSGKKYAVIILTGFFLANCTPSVERYKNKARKALQNEDSQKALQYLQKAFELSLDDQFFPLGKNHEYSNLYSPVNRNKMLLVENQPSKVKAYFTVYEIARDNDWRRRVKGFIRNVALSPDGHYALLHMEQSENVCKIDLWDLQSREQVSFSGNIPCNESGGVSNTGEVVFIGQNKAVNRFIPDSEKLDEKYIAELPSPPEKSIPAWGSFQFSPRNHLYLTYGALGLYHLYSVEKGQLKLVNKDAASPKIFFSYNSDNPGLITGGANNHQVVFLNVDHSFDEVQSFPVRFWKDAVFLNSSEYFYIEDERLVYVNNNKEDRLLFWASKVYADTSGKVYLLSPRGSLIGYNKVNPSEESKAIFQMGWEIK
ncbi:MAG: hypothetical protein OEV66_03775 [Spirochaetia bacterium]|nr:hypothetical protein [Spirochaetia bacterium]